MYLRKKKIFISLFLILLAIYLPIFKLNLDVSTLLSVFSLLFAILVGFFIATATTNYLRLQTLIAEEDAGLIAVFNLVRSISPSELDKIVEVIDTYAISALSFELTEYVNKTHFEFNNVALCIDNINFSESKGQQLISSLHDKKNSLFRTRQEIALVARSIVTVDHWIVIISLGVLVGFLILTLRDGGFLSAFISGILLMTNYLVLTLLYEVDNNRFLEQALSYQNSQQIFTAIGRPPYYLDIAVKSGRVGVLQGKYRTGYYNSFDDNDMKLVESEH